MHFIGELSALGAAILWSFSSFVFTEATKRISTFQLNLSRLFFAWVFLVVTILVLGLNYQVSTTQLLFLSISGVIGLTFGDWFLFKSFKEIGPRVSMLIMSLNPAIAAIIAYFALGEKISALGIFGMVVTLAGISLVVLEKRDGENEKFKITRLGVLMGVLAAFGQGIGLIFSKYAFLAGDVHSLVATFIRIFAAYITLLPIGIILKRYQNPIKVYMKDKKAFGLVILGSIIGPYLGITFSFIAVIYTQVGVAATLMSTSPIMILPLSMLFYKEKLSWKPIVGAIIAVGGISLLFLT